jgi:hypothetical protein
MSDFGNQAHQSWDALSDVAWKGIRPGATGYNKYYLPSLRESYGAARRLDETPAIFSGYGRAMDQTQDWLNRRNMGNTGSAISAMGKVSAEQTMAAQEAQTRARLAKQQALQGLAQSSLSGYLGAMQPLQYAVSGKTGVDMARMGVQQQQQAAQNQMYSDAFSSIGNMGGSMFGGADKPWIFG